MPSNDKFQQIISQIRNGTFESDRVDMARFELEDEHFGTLIAAINSNKELKQRLQVLDLRFNNFRDLSRFEIVDFPALQVISLQGFVKKLDSMPKIAKCPELYSIDLSGNNLDFLSLSDLKALESLLLQNNKFKENPKIEHKDFPVLKQINLENNGMERFIPYESYLKTSKLFMSAGNKLNADTLSEIKTQRNKAIVYTKTPAADWSAYLTPQFFEPENDYSCVPQCCFQ